MANERRSEAAEAPFWSSAWDTANQVAATADQALGGTLSAAAGVVNPVVAPFVNPFLPEGSKIEPSFSGIRAKQQEAFKEAPRDWQNLANMPHPGSMAGLADDAAKSMLVFAYPAMKRLQAAGMLDKKTADAYNELPKYGAMRDADQVRREWDQGFARTSDFWGSSPERMRSDSLLLYVPSQDFRLKQPLPDGYTTSGKVQDLFHINPQVQAAMPPGMGEVDAYLRPNSGISLGDSQGAMRSRFPELLDPRQRPKNWPHPDGRVFSESEMEVTSHPSVIEDIAAHEWLGHGPQQTEVGLPYYKQSKAADDKRLPPEALETPATSALERDYNKLRDEIWEIESKSPNPMNPSTPESEALRRELQDLEKRIRASEDLTNYDDKPGERWARWVQAQHSMSLDDVRASPPGLNDNFFGTALGDIMSRRKTGLPHVYHKPSPFEPD